MATCTICGKAAGLFKSKHPACVAQENRRAADMQHRQTAIQRSVVAAVLEPSEASRIADCIKNEVDAKILSPGAIREAIVKGWCESVARCLEDGVIDEEEEQRLIVFKDGFKLTEEELDKEGAHTRVVQSAVIRDLLNGVLPERMQLTAPLPINLEKGEKVIWVFSGCDYLEDRTKREYQGGSRGVSIRVMRGVYYRVGAFKGSSVNSTERIHVDTGKVYLTNKHVYFAGPQKSLRVPYAKIVSFLPFDDGFGLIRDAQTAKPQIFKTGDGWFAYNLVTNVAQFKED